MRRSLLLTSVITAVALVLTGASTCGPQGPAAKDFAAGSLVIPMDNCYQRRDGGAGAAPCNATADDGVFRAYGLVYFLLKNNVTVYWAIDNTKTDPKALDISAPAVAGGYAAQHMRWSDGTFPDNVGTQGNAINYVGGPFVIDATDVPRAVGLFQSSSDFARFKAEAIVDVHKVATGFHATQVRTLTGPPPKLAILNINPGGKKTSSNVMYQYAFAAGLSWPCNGNGDCAGGLGSHCDKAGVLAYLASGGPAGNQDAPIPQVCTPSGSTFCAPNFNQGTGSGQIYDLLCDGDFVPPGSTAYKDLPSAFAATDLAKGGYKMLWIPHWDSSGPDPTAAANPPALNPTPGSNDALAWQLHSIASFVQSGNNLFVECMGIQSLEGIAGQDNVNGSPLGLPDTRFQTGTGIKKWNGSGSGAVFVTQPNTAVAQPNMQIGDYTFSLVSGAITTYFPDATKTTANAYLAATQRLLTENAPSPTPPPAWDVSSTIQVTGPDGSQRGTVAYMGGHNYAPTADLVGGAPATLPSQHSSAGQTAGTRIVLNTLFNLGFGCADPNTTCSTGLLGACATGTLKCAGGGGLQCVAPAAGAVDCTTPNADANCNGIPDAQEAACAPKTCTEGATRTCFDGPAGAVFGGKSVCKQGTQTCTGGAWSACAGEVLPQPEVCNGLDDNCDGTVDEGTLCANGSCQSGICLPSSCSSEGVRCPTGFSCDSASSKCVAVACPGNGGAACPAGQACLNSACADPCAGVTCGSGSSCSGGQCVAGGCALDASLCTNAGQVCIQGSCFKDPCAGLACPEGTFCRVGPEVNGTYVADCVRSCSYTSCPPGQTCGDDGFCQAACSPACAAGQVCLNGACAADRCLNVTCGAGQECSAGACVDSSCKHVQCGTGSCVAGQCVVTGITPTVTTPLKPVQGGGCGTGGSGGGVASVALVLAALLVRRRGLAPVAVPARVRGAARRALPLALVALLGSGAACSKNGSPSCASGQTACGAECADLQTSSLHCGACGTGCGTGFQCTAGSCQFATGNPHLVSIEPASIGRGASPKLQFTFDGVSPQPKTLLVRLTGAVAAQELPLSVDADGKASLPAGQMVVDQESTGTIEARLLNMPNRLLSNALPIAVVDKLVARAVTPPLVRQDNLPAPVTALVIQGLNFVQGATVAIAPASGGTGQTLPVTTFSTTSLAVTPPDVTRMPIGPYAIRVTNPDATVSDPITFTISEGAPGQPTVAGGTCIVGGGPMTGVVSAAYLYPNTSVAHVTGGAINNSPLTTSCKDGVDATTGQCQNGTVQVQADLTSVPLGTYDLTIVNPGPLVSPKTTITVKAGCP